MQTLLGQKYGHKPLHTHILQEDFELIHAAIEDSSSRFLVQQWYILDTNAEPPEYVLQAWDSETYALNVLDSPDASIPLYYNNCLITASV